MSVDIWFTQDIGQIILAAVRANEQALAAERADSDLPHDLAYHQGFRAALSAVALALGLPTLPAADDEEHCTVVQSPLGTDTALSSLNVGRDRGRAHALALPCSGGEVHGGDRSAVV